MSDVIDLRACKREAVRCYPPGHPVREALLREPDTLPAAEGRAKLETYMRWVASLGRVDAQLAAGVLDGQGHHHASQDPA